MLSIPHSQLASSTQEIALKVSHFEALINKTISDTAASQVVANNISLITIVVAFVSIVLTVASLKYQRRHHRLSLVPVPYISLGDYDQRAYVRIDNNGPGPLEIRNFTVNHTIKKDTFDNLIDALDIADDLVWRDFVKEINGRSVRPGGDLYLIDVDLDQSTIDSSVKRELLRLELSQMSISFDYYDVFKKKIGKCERALNWFDR